MSVRDILVLAVSLALDGVAVAAARGVAARSIRARDVMLVAGCFGGAHVLMPLLGWLIGASVGPFVVEWDHWIAFGVLSALGGRALWEARQQPHAESDLAAARATPDPFALTAIATLALATSVDALAVGVTLPMLHAPMLESIAAIGATTALLSALALFAGRRLGSLLGAQLDIASGLLLIGIGLKILIEHIVG